MKIVVIAVFLLLAGLLLVLLTKPVNHGQCLATRRVPTHTMLSPVLIGKSTVLLPRTVPAHDECSEWEYPNGKKNEAK